MKIAKQQKALRKAVLGLVGKLSCRPREHVNVARCAGGMKPAPAHGLPMREDLIAVTAEQKSDEPADIAGHCAVAAQFRGFAEQEIQHFARMVCKKAGTARRHDLAQMHSNWCRTLCDPTLRSAVQPDAGGEEQGRLVRRLVARMNEFCHQAEEYGGHVSFDFSSGLGVQVSELQQPWTLCDASDPIAFVVIPAYTVNGKRLSQQIVYTT